ncbi:MAG: polyprenyl synthetase family protein [Pseudomonadota bacterium]
MAENPHLEATITSVIDRAVADGAPKKLARALPYAVFPGGARVRPNILLAVAKACGVKDITTALQAAAALELIHCASLVHDDMPCFDDADLRRGKPTVHMEFGEEIALLTGDTLIVMAFEAIAFQPSDPKISLNLVRLLARYTGAPHGICAGQAWESEQKVNLAQYHRAKTGALFIAATEMGAVVAGQPIAAWTDLGARIGSAYQVADDLMDALYTAEQLGKPVGQDVAHARPNAVEELGVKGAIGRLEDTLAGAISSIPHCEGEAALAGLVRAQAERLTPLMQKVAAL